MREIASAEFPELGFQGSREWTIESLHALVARRVSTTATLF